ncbi:MULTISPECIES: hypothetical protein [unclassified Streptomyces]|uniref:hypothetical protein n=1 Tax=unclassified Streptomyces TaxID=2593676 RepID=UPI00081E4440|nr:MULTISPECIES: hypothetical protein [unclassified Streptomyces]SCF69824.1 hypothetical protein GA0115259_101186 [Streptomyces sp. MnatMP-M17]
MRDSTSRTSTAVMHLVKLAVFGAAAVLTTGNALTGPALAPASTAGAWTGKKIVDRLPVPVFIALVEASLVISGLLLIIGGQPRHRHGLIPPVAGSP